MKANIEEGNRFIAGLALSKLFYEHAVKPILDDDFKDLRYSAGLIGSGSEVLGFDTEMSSDHHWGPRVMLFLEEEPYLRNHSKIRKTLSDKLPRRFLGYPTSFTPPDPQDHGTQLFDLTAEGPVNHRVEIHTAKGYFLDYLGFDISETIHPADWLTLPEQKLATITGGAIFRDDIGVEKIRQRFSYYPHDVWLYLLAAAWTRIEQEEHLMGRTGFVGDEIGSAIIASRLVRDLIRLCFLMEKKYAPYPKWFGTAFAKLKAAAKLEPLFKKTLSATDWQERQAYLAEAYEYVAQCHNDLCITAAMPTAAKQFFTRPFQVISMGAFSKEIVSKISDKTVKDIASKRAIGAIDQFSDSTDLLSDPSWRQTLRGLYSTR